YVNRTLTVDKAITANEATAVLYNPITGSMAFVPATFSTINGTTEVTIKRNGNSIYTIVQFNKKFADLGGHWAKSDIEQMASKLIVKGYTETTFKPNENITRAQFASILIQSLGLAANKGGAAFSDVNTKDWYSGFIGAASAAGLTSGFSDGTFKPNDLISREQMAVMISKAIKFSGKQTIPSGTQDKLLLRFSDKDAISSWAKSAAAQCIDAGIISGLGDKSFAPSAKATRAQAVVMVKHMLEYVGFMD
ncbi:MAG TPA: S-layer homology domain-containing protein, partial [Bacilli bacterium]